MCPVPTRLSLLSPLSPLVSCTPRYWSPIYSGRHGEHSSRVLRRERYGVAKQSEGVQFCMKRYLLTANHLDCTLL